LGIYTIKKFDAEKRKGEEGGNLSISEVETLEMVPTSGKILPNSPIFDRVFPS
jgi:hypothetical protein